MKAVKITPADGLIKIKPKGKPRGIAFPKNNSYGLATRFKPGQSGNPNGRTSEEQRAASLLSKALTERLPQVGTKASLRCHGRTFTQKLADVWIQQGLDGNIGAIVAIADRIEGKPAVSISHDGSGDNLSVLIAGMHEMSARLGPPEGFVPLLPGGEGEEPEQL